MEEEAEGAAVEHTLAVKTGMKEPALEDVAEAALQVAADEEAVGEGMAQTIAAGERQQTRARAQRSK